MTDNRAYSNLNLNDSVNVELDRYLAGLPDLSKYPRPINIDVGFFGLGDGVGYDIQDNLEIAFAEDDSKLEKNEQDHLDELLNNFIADKNRRFPNDRELAQWLGRVTPTISHCKIFDMRGLNYLQSDIVLRFVVIVHLEVETWYYPTPWCQFWIPGRFP